MKRYNIWAEGDPHESELIVEENSLGKWLKFYDLKDIKSRDARIIKLHSKINELTHELELTKERLHLAKSNSAPLSVVGEVLERYTILSCSGFPIIGESANNLIKEINQKGGR